MRVVLLNGDLQRVVIRIRDRVFSEDIAEDRNAVRRAAGNATAQRLTIRRRVQDAVPTSVMPLGPSSYVPPGMQLPPVPALYGSVGQCRSSAEFERLRRRTESRNHVPGVNVMYGVGIERSARSAPYRTAAGGRRWDRFAAKIVAIPRQVSAFRSSGHAMPADGEPAFPRTKRATTYLWSAGARSSDCIARSTAISDGAGIRRREGAAEGRPIDASRRTRRGRRQAHGVCGVWLMTPVKRVGCIAAGLER